MADHANGESRYRPVLDVASQRIARVYAEALLNVVDKDGEAEAIQDQLSALVDDVFAKDPRLETFLNSMAVGREHKANVIQTTFGGRVSEKFLNFILVLNDHDRLDLFRGVVAEYRQLFELRRGQIHVLVQSATPLPDDQRENLIRSLREMFHREPVMDLQVDPELLGGLVLRVGDWLYDHSVRTQLNNIRNQLFESASHEIQSRRDRFSSAS